MYLEDFEFSEKDVMDALIFLAGVMRKMIWERRWPEYYKIRAFLHVTGLNDEEIKKLDSKIVGCGKGIGEPFVQKVLAGVDSALERQDRWK